MQGAGGGEAHRRLVEAVGVLAVDGEPVLQVVVQPVAVVRPAQRLPAVRSWEAREDQLTSAAGTDIAGLSVVAWCET